MPITVAQFGRECYGVEKVCQRFGEVPQDQEFVETYRRPYEGTSRNILYADPAPKFCALTQGKKRVGNTEPHDHADTWAIYGVSTGNA